MTDTDVLALVPTLSYAAPPRRVEWSRDGAAADASVPVDVPSRAGAIWPLGRRWWGVLPAGMIGGFLFDGVIRLIHHRGVRMAAIAAVVCATSFAVAGVAGAVRLWLTRPGRLHLDADGLAVTNLTTGRIRRWARVEIEVVKVDRIGRSSLGQLRVQFKTGKRVGVGLADAAGLSAVAAAFNAALAEQGNAETS